MPSKSLTDSDQQIALPLKKFKSILSNNQTVVGRYKNDLIKAKSNIKTSELKIDTLKRVYEEEKSKREIMEKELKIYKGKKNTPEMETLYKTMLLDGEKIQKSIDELAEEDFQKNKDKELEEFKKSLGIL